MDVKLNGDMLKRVRGAVQRAAMQTMDALKTDVTAAQVTPKDQGDLEREAFVQPAEEGIGACLTYDRPYARYQYYGKSRTGKDLRYQTVNNPGARSHWLEPWLPGGENEDFVRGTMQTMTDQEVKKL